MITEWADIMAIDENELQNRGASLQPEEIGKLVEWLSLKEDTIRYRAFLLLREKSRIDASVYPFWKAFRMKLKSDNSYQRSLGIMLIAENVQWDTTYEMKDTLPEYLQVLQDEKPITVRQCIQALKMIAQKAPRYNEVILKALLSYDVMAVRETMRKLILNDIINTLLEIRKNSDCNEINNYIFMALSGEILDVKSKKVIEKLL